MYLQPFPPIFNTLINTSPADAPGGSPNSSPESPRQTLSTSLQQLRQTFGDFAPFVAMGHTADLFFLIPPGAPLRQESHLTPEKIRQAKIPGDPKFCDGWIGLVGRNRITANENLLAQWANDARMIGGPVPNVGFNTREIHGFDCDTEDPELSRLVHELWQTHLTLGLRTRENSNHWLAPIKLVTPIHHIAIKISAATNGSEKRLGLVEVIATGQQMLVAGRRADGTRWTWQPTANGQSFLTVPRGAIEAIPNEFFSEKWREFQALLKVRGYLINPTGGVRIHDAVKTLTRDPAPDLEAVRIALSYVPDRNTPENPIDYHSLVTWLHAIAAACNGSPEGEAIAVQWTKDYEDGSDVEAEVRRIYRSIDPGACRIGYSWLQDNAVDVAQRMVGSELAAECAGKLARFEFDGQSQTIGQSAGPTPPRPKHQTNSNGRAVDAGANMIGGRQPAATVDFDADIAQHRGQRRKPGQPPRYRDYIAGGLVLRGKVTQLNGPPKTFKTGFLLLVAASLAIGRDLAGIGVAAKPLRVYMAMQEDDDLDFEILMEAFLQQHALNDAELALLDENLIVRTLGDAPLILGTATRDDIDDIDGNVIAFATWCKRSRIDLVILDPRRPTFRGLPENSPQHIDILGIALRKLARLADVGVIVSHHFNKASAQKPTEMADDPYAASGTAAQVGSTRATFNITPATDEFANSIGSRAENVVKVTFAIGNYRPRWKERYYEAIGHDFKDAAGNIDSAAALVPIPEKDVNEWKSTETEFKTHARARNEFREAVGGDDPFGPVEDTKSDHSRIATATYRAEDHTLIGSRKIQKAWQMRADTVLELLDRIRLRPLKATIPGIGIVNLRACQGARGKPRPRGRWVVWAKLTLRDDEESGNPLSE